MSNEKPPLLLDLYGMRVGRLAVLNSWRRSSSGRIEWLCKCDCGNEKWIYSSNLKRSHKRKPNQSCGCLKVENASQITFKHGKSHTPTHNSWNSMIHRCFHIDHSAYKYYGGRGITVCERWIGEYGFENFYADMGDRPIGKTLDRYPDSKGNYEPSNCRWATKHEQDINRRNNVMYTYNGQTHCLTEWSRILGVDYNFLNGRMNWRKNGRRSWTVEQAFTIPSGRGRARNKQAV